MASDILPNQLSVNTDLEGRLLPKVLELVRSPDGHRICLGNWSTVQLERLADALTESDTAAAREAVLLDISRHLVQRIDSIWEQRKQAKFLQAAASLHSADPALLRYFQRKFKPYSPPRPSAPPHAFYGVRLGHIPGVYTSWKDVQLQTIRIHSDVKRFKTRKKAEDFVA